MITALNVPTEVVRAQAPPRIPPGEFSHVLLFTAGILTRVPLRRPLPDHIHASMLEYAKIVNPPAPSK